MPDAELRTTEATELAHAWAQALADASHTRILAIKGATLSYHGLRRGHVSRDIDVLVEPAGFEAFCAQVEAAGWQARPSTFLGEHTTTHSITYFHPQWPVDVDAHRFYPGFLAPADEVFDELWRRRVTIDFAHRPCAATDKIAAIAILALHSLRGKRAQGRHLAELDDLLSRVTLDDTERADLASFAERVDCVEALGVLADRDVLVALGAVPSGAGDDITRTSPELTEWRGRVEGTESGAAFWLFAFRQARWRDRPRMIARAFWPSRADLLIRDPTLPDLPGARVRARVARIGKGLRQVLTSSSGE